RQLLRAWPGPGGPTVDQYDFPPELGRADDTTSGIFEGELEGLPDLRTGRDLDPGAPRLLDRPRRPGLLGRATHRRWYALDAHRVHALEGEHDGIEPEFLLRKHGIANG